MKKLLLAMFIAGCGASQYPVQVQDFVDKYGYCRDVNAVLSTRRHDYDTWIVRACGADMLVHCTQAGCEVPRDTVWR